MAWPWHHTSQGRNYVSRTKNPPEHKKVISELTHQSPCQREEHKFISSKLCQWFPQADNYFHEYDASAFIGGKHSDNKPHGTIITRFNLSVVLRIECKKESEGYEAGFSQGLQTLLEGKGGTVKRQFLAVVVGSQVKFFQDNDGYLSRLDGITDAESVQAIDCSTNKGAKEAYMAARYIKEEYMKTRNDFSS